MFITTAHTARPANDNATITARAIAAVPSVKRFEVGREYWTRSICDYECIFRFTVIKRTAKTVTLRAAGGKEVRRGISVWQNEETCSPHGRYSMSPTLSAGRQG
jgi:hypothetical protein